MSRKATSKRNTKETSITVTIDLDGSGKTSVKTGVKFLDHLIISFGKHSLIDVTINAKSNDDIMHHLIEDTAITLGQTINKALGDRRGITRFGYASIPMDESLAESSVDLVKRQYYKLSLDLKQAKTEDTSREDLVHFFQSLLQNLNSCIHVTVKYGVNDHHKVEAAIKSLAVSLRTALSFDARQKGIPSTKGAM